jgi:large subunit ribosomal protein L16
LSLLLNKVIKAIAKMKKTILLPKITKFKKQQKGHLKSIERKQSATSLYYGIYGLKVLKYSRLKSQQLESARKKISRHLRKHERL